MEVLALVASVVIFLLITWQLVGSILNIIGIVVGLFRD